VLAGCSNDNFTIEGVITDIGEHPIKASYVNEAGVQKVEVPTEGGRFLIEGTSTNYTMVQLFNFRNELITKVIMKNGDDLKLKGTLNHKYLIEMKGSEVNEDWNNFRRENHNFYSDENIESVNTKIEEYVAKNGNKIASLALILFDYNNLDNSTKAHELLNSLDEKAIPASLIKAYSDIKALTKATKDDSRIYHSLPFYNQNDSLTSFMPLRGKMSLLYFADKDDDRKPIIATLDTLFYNYKNTPKGKTQLQIADIMLDNDTMVWKRTLRGEDTDWQHFWAVGGIMNPTINEMLITRTPYFIMLDSVGHTIYRGESIDSIIAIADARLIKMSEKEKAKARDKKEKEKEKKRKEKQRILNEKNRFNNKTAKLKTR
jgi:hypothetical protein